MVKKYMVTVVGSGQQFDGGNYKMGRWRVCSTGQGPMEGILLFSQKKSGERKRKVEPQQVVPQRCLYPKAQVTVMDLNKN